MLAVFRNSLISVDGNHVQAVHVGYVGTKISTGNVQRSTDQIHKTRQAKLQTDSAITKPNH